MPSKMGKVLPKKGKKLHGAELDSVAELRGRLGIND